MQSLIYVIFTVLNGAIEIVTLLMLIRAILSWFPIVDRSSKIMSFILYGDGGRDLSRAESSLAL